jgi:hypothetical protein
MAPSQSADHNSTVIAVAELKSEEVGIWKQDVNEMPAQDAERQRRSAPARAWEARQPREWLRQHAPTPYQTTHHVPICFSQCSFEHRAAVAAAGRRS